MSNVKILKQKLYFNTLFLFIGFVLYKGLLDILYKNHLVPIFGYTGFLYDFNLGKYIISWILLIAVIPIITSIIQKNSLSSTILLLLILLSYVPFTTMVGYYNFENDFIFLNVLYWFLLFFFYKLVPNFKVKRISNDKLTSLILNNIIFIFFLVIIYISWRYTGFRVTIDIFNVYDLRSEAVSFQLPALISYIYSASKAINPLLLIYFLGMKKYYSASFVLFVQILSFSINGSKTVMFTTLIALLIFFFYKNRHKKLLVWFFVFLCVISIFENLIYNSIFTLAFLIRRVLFLPNMLNYYYYDFFQSNSPDYLSQSFLRHFGLDSNYSMPIDNIIGMVYFNQPNMGANNGLISDALANFGPIGILFYPLLIIVTLKIMDLSTDGLDYRVFVISALTLTFIFISSFYFTILFTHGLFALIVVLFLLPRRLNSEHTNRGG